MADINNIKDTVLNTLGTVAGKVGDLTDKAMDKAKEMARITKLNMELNSEKSTMEKTYTEIGKLYYETNGTNPDSFFVQLCDEITLGKEKIAELQEEIASIKAASKNSDGSIEVEFSEISEDEFEKTDAPAEEKSSDCSCGCSEHKEN